MSNNAICRIRKDEIPEWIEEVKEVKSIYDLKEGDFSWRLHEDLSI
jgi:hypothetical protein